MQSLVYSIALVLNAATLSPAASVAGTPQASTAEDRTVCRKFRKTGTRFDERICKRASEWQAIEEKSQSALREIQGRPKINCTSPSGGAC